MTNDKSKLPKILRNIGIGVGTVGLVTLTTWGNSAKSIDTIYSNYQGRSNDEGKITIYFDEKNLDERSLTGTKYKVGKAPSLRYSQFPDYLNPDTLESGKRYKLIVEKPNLSIFSDKIMSIEPVSTN